MASLAHGQAVGHGVVASSGSTVRFPRTTEDGRASAVMAADSHRALASTVCAVAEFIPELRGCLIWHGYVSSIWNGSRRLS
jgi:hypothetical protein